MKRPILTRVSRGLFAVLVTGGLGASVLASTAGADPPGNGPGGTGYVEICKVMAPSPVTIDTTAAFSFHITGVNGSVSVDAGSCSGEIPVPAGSQTVTETGAPWYQVGSITELPGQSYLTASNLAAGSATVSVSAGANVEELTYTNDPLTGYLEVCKQAVTGSGLTGSYTFDVTGEDGFTATTTVPVGACSPAMQVPAGTVTTSEAGTNLYVTGISASLNGAGNELVGSPDLTTGTATETVMASSDASTQTDVTYTNDSVALKVCKIWDPSNGAEPGGSTTTFPFSFTASGVAGPNTAPGPVSIQAGTAERAGVLEPGLVPPGHHGLHHRGDRPRDQGRGDLGDRGRVHRGGLAQPHQPDDLGRRRDPDDLLQRADRRGGRHLHRRGG